MATLCSPAIAATSRRTILNASADGPARYIVALNDDVDDISSVADELSRKHHGRLGHRFSRALRGFVTGAAALYLQDHPSASPAVVALALISSASVNKVSNAGPGSPNRLLFTGDIALPLRRRAVRQP